MLYEIARRLSFETTELFIEQTDSLMRRFEPLSGAEIWKIEGNFYHAQVSAIASQITVAAANQNGLRTVTLVDAPTGKTITQFEITISVNTPLNGCLLTADQQILCNFVAESRTDILHRDFNYWTAYDATAKKVLWRTAMNSRSASSLFPFMSDKVRFE